MQGGRDFSLYASAMDRGLLAKAELIFPHLEVPEGGVILDLGSGTGALAEFAALNFSRATVLAQDKSHELNDLAKTKRSLIEILQADALTQILPSESLDAAYSCSVFHEIETFCGSGSMRRAARIVYDELKAGGMFVIRDFVRPPEDRVLLKILDLNSNDQMLDVYEKASAPTLFEYFCREFQGGAAFDYSHRTILGDEYIELPLWAAYEFVMREPYRRNWRNEIQETYGHWTIESAVRDLTDAGFVRVEIIPEDNEFILKNRIHGRFALYSESKEGSLSEIEFPHTHMTIVAHKAGEASSQPALALAAAIDYKALIDSIVLNSAQSVISIDDQPFQLSSKPPIIGTKRAVFYLQGDEAVIKIPRSDSTNIHNAFKSMMQAIERQNLLKEYGVRHLEILQIDEKGPPYRYFIQNSLPTGSECIADIIKRGELLEVEVKELCQWINKFEGNRQFQLDTNPYNWFRVPIEDGSTKLTYADGKVYQFDEHWAFTKIGLIQWSMPEFIPESPDLHCAIIPATSFSENPQLWWTPQSNVAQGWFSKYLDRSLTASLL